MSESINHRSGLSMQRMMRRSSVEITVEELRRYFVMIALAGIVWMVLVAIIGIGQFLAMFGSMALMGTYFWAYRKGREPAALRDTFSDSAYYLGFLLTVIALIVTMIHFGYTSDTFDAASILSQFGMAMVTTLLGLLIRVYYKQFDLTIEDAQASAHQTLEQSVKAFSVQMSMVNDTLGKLSQTMDKNVEAIEQRNEKAIDSVTRSLDRVEAVGEGAIDRFSAQVHEQITRNMRDLEIHAHQSLDEIKTTAASYREAGDRFANESTATIQNAIETAHAASFERVNQSFATVAGKATTFSEAVEQARQSCSQLGQSVSTVSSSLDDHSSRISTRLISVESDLSGVSDNHKRLAVALKQMTEEADAQLKELAQREVETAAQVTAVMQEYQKTASELREAMTLPGLKRLNAEDDQWLDTLESHRQRMDELNGSLGRHAEDMASNVELFGDNMVQTATFITSQLKAAEAEAKKGR